MGIPTAYHPPPTKNYQEEKKKPPYLKCKKQNWNNTKTILQNEIYNHINCRDSNIYK